jgi:ubiquinol-cytochrome c reductase iron-sulfur subunit
MTAIAQTNVDEKKRRLLLIATSAAGAVAGAGIAGPFIASWFPRRAGARRRRPGRVRHLEARARPADHGRVARKPVWILKRTPEMIEKLNGHDAVLVDPKSEASKQPAYVKGPGRSIKPELFVAEGVCTHLGCSPTAEEGDRCRLRHGRRLAGRLLLPLPQLALRPRRARVQGIAGPSNLTIPPHRYASEAVLVIGEDTKGA